MILDIIYILIIVIFGLAFINLFKKQLSSYDLTILRILFFFHLLFGVYFSFFIDGDAISYWTIPKAYSFDEFTQGLLGGEGTIFMYAFNYIFSNILDMSYLSNTLVFSLLGFIGLTFFYLVIIVTIKERGKIYGYSLFPLVFFLPNLHFWSSGIGKDTILFLCIGSFSYGVLKPSIRFPLVIFSLTFAIAIRPHIVLFLLVGFGTAYLFGGKISGLQRIAFSVIFIGIGIVILPSVMDFVNIEEATMESFGEFAEDRANSLSRSHTGSAIDMSSYPLPLKVLTFWFRPFLFDVNNLNSLIIAIENTFLLCLVLLSLKKHPFKALSTAPFVVKGLMFFLLLGTVTFSQVLGNLGIMIRMRNMFLPGLLIYILWVFHYRQQSMRMQIPKGRTSSRFRK